MKKKLFIFTIDNHEKAEQIILESKIYHFKPIFYIKNYIVKGFGSDFILNLKNLLISRFGSNSFKLYVDCGYNHSLSIEMITKKIEYIKLKGNPSIMSKIKNIATKNKVSLNPSFNVVDFKNIKKIKSKIQNL